LLAGRDILLANKEFTLDASIKEVSVTVPYIGRKFKLYLSEKEDKGTLVDAETGRIYFVAKGTNALDFTTIHNEMRKAVRWIVSIEKDRDLFKTKGFAPVFLKEEELYMERPKVEDSQKKGTAKTSARWRSEGWKKA